MESPVCAAAMTPTDPGAFRVIETFGWDGSRFPRLAAHLARLAATCARFGIAFDPMQVLVRLDALPEAVPQRVRVTVNRGGSVAVTHAALVPVAGPWRVGMAAERIWSGDPWLAVKTTERRLYDRVRAGLAAGIDEMLFLNERGEVCEGTITNLFFDAGQGLCTPPLRCGLLPGILRAEVLATGQCREAVLPGAMPTNVQLWVGNALRGLIPAVLAKEGQ